MSKFTKGPWLIDGRTVYALEHAGWRKGKELFRNRFSSTVQGGPDTPLSELEAVAKIQHAAPELLDALKKARVIVAAYVDEAGPCDHSVNICVCGLKSELDEIDAAISKAEGA